MPNLGAGEWLIILLVIVILFGSTRLPTVARSLGKSMRILKSETKGLHKDDEDDTPQPTAKSPQELPAAKGDATTLNGVPLPDSERSHKTS